MVSGATSWLTLSWLWQRRQLRWQVVPRCHRTSFSEAWPRAPPSKPLRQFPKQLIPYITSFFFALNPDCKGVYGRPTAERFSSYLHLTLFFYRHINGPSEMHTIPIVLPNEYTISPRTATSIIFLRFCLTQVSPFSSALASFSVARDIHVSSTQREPLL